MVISSPLGAARAWDDEKARLVLYSASLSRAMHLEQVEERRTHSERLGWLESLASLSPSQQEDWLSSTTTLQQLTLHDARQFRVRAHVPAIDSEEGHSVSVRLRLSQRRESMMIAALSPSQGAPPTTDITTALSITHAHFQAHFTPTPVSDSDQCVAQDDLLDPLWSATRKSDARFSRPMSKPDALSLDRPFDAREILAAIASTDFGRSPGPSGLPYKFYRTNPTAAATILTAVFNDVWERGSLTPSMADARVRLLPKVKKVGFDAAFLGHYRPVTLRETDYKLLSKVLVSRLNPILPSIFPPAQHRFVTGRRAANAATHLSLLLEEVAVQGYTSAALLSLDQASAYDKVGHDWILCCYEAFGAQPCFLALLRTIYSDALTARYIINGFLTSAVTLGVGLGQGDPLSCPSWNVSFQLFLDALVRRRIVLQLSYLSPLPRLEILSLVAFADDVAPIIKSAASLALLSTLRRTWKHASNGDFNKGKTEAMPLGELWSSHPLSASVSTLAPGEGVTWVGFPFS